MPRVRFLRDTDPTEHGAGPAFVAGQVVSLKATSAHHWKSLGAAVDAPDDPEPEDEAPPAPPAAAEPEADPTAPPRKTRAPRADA